jgi:hypothetical protein
MSCQLTDGGPSSIFPLTEEQITSLREMGRVFVTSNTPSGSRLVARFGAAMKPDGVPFYLMTYSPETPTRDEWRGLFVMEQGPFQINGTVRAVPATGVMSVHSTVLRGQTTVVDVRWDVMGPAVGTNPTNVAGMLTGTEIMNPGPHAPDCLRDCLALHAPQCVPMREGNEPQLVATVAAIAASCLIICRC